ncbi:histidine kinase [Actinoplanes sp. LDG1-06]|uniref:Histidine kinase n=1 Tax=Paractinoplanes ovalisporus TaxID=2810368 RepID=A0ABS2AEQ1_9ACTN|nr:histidine kinase [Actinoplanes ovalisporus]MBM2618315.1 histidine kinase [Actinoplanes ovalisporus]
MRSQTDRFELYIKVTLYSNVLLVPLIAGGAILVGDRIGPEVVPIITATTVHVVLCVLLMRSGIANYPDGPRPARLIAATGLWTAITAATAVVTYPRPTPGHPDSPFVPVLLMVTALYAVALATHVSATIVLSTVGSAGCVTLAIVDRPASALTLAVILAVLAPAARVTLWTLGLVRELDQARHVQAGLAVAEERLRISRDLHDVLGRTLSVVALKAELSARLAQRGRPEAADEMLEVRRIAQAALTDLRTVVGGYRAAGLPSELAGARTLLESAGITCHVSGEAAGAGLAESAQAALGWVVREGTTNVLRHSEAQTCRITLTTTARTVSLTLENDGAPHTPFELGNGLTGLTERLTALGGTATATRTAPDSFRLAASLPLTPPAAPPSAPLSAPPHASPPGSGAS